MKQALFQQIDFSAIGGRVLVIGDVHGCFEILDQKLSEMNYDSEKDRLVFLGDLIDRGPASRRALEIVEAGHPRVVGNHEDMFYRAFAGDIHERYFWKSNFIRNGGRWIEEENWGESKRKEVAEKLYDAPVALEIKTPGGNIVGVVHASVPRDDWKFMANSLLEEYVNSDILEHCLWDRSKIQRLQYTTDSPRTEGIDHVFFGHTPVKDILTHKNNSWIDTHAYKCGNLMILDIDKFLDSL
jgi:serine/threonine protein phosphatase 1